MSGPKKRKGGMNVVIGDVAREAQVSPMTVSRYLRSPEMIREDLRERVARAIAATGYIQDRVASALASQRSGLVAVILPTIASSIFTDSIRGISEVVRSRGAQLVIAETLYSQMEEEKVVEAILGRRPDGLIIVGVSHTHRARMMIERSGIPVVETWDDTRNPIQSLVSLSNFKAARDMTRALVELGYKRIAFVAAASKDRRSAMRTRGYIDGLGVISGQEPMIINVENIASMDEGEYAATKILEYTPPPDAVFFLNDILATGTLFALQRRGIAVPGQVGIAGFGDFDFSKHINPSLTTVHIPRFEIGTAAAGILMDRIEGKSRASVRHAVSYAITLRNSTARR